MKRKRSPFKIRASHKGIYVLEKLEPFKEVPIMKWPPEMSIDDFFKEVKILELKLGIEKRKRRRK